MVVMAIIPFGLVGTIYGHHLWDVPLSMFTVVGLIGMTGIIINDSIVLVTTIDEYAKDRGLIPAIIEGASDRLRPVMLTTLTTVLGLTPLLYESSAQAQFLKPTVITLVYGLGFGMILILFIVPALIAMQMDVARQVTAMRRALQLPKRAKGIGAATALGSLGAVGLFAGTLGVAALTDALHPTLVAAFPALAGMPALPTAFLLFLAGLAVWLLCVFVVVAIVSTLMRRPRVAA
jgi:predicted RND superfamily exporter protein